MTYKEIIGQIARRMGYDSFADLPRADIKYALAWAENEVGAEVEPVRKSYTVSLDGTTTEWNLPADFSEPREIVFFDSSNNRLEHVELPFEEYARYSGDDISTDTDDLISDLAPGAAVEYARLGNKVLVAIDRRVVANIGVYIAYVKPQFVGTMYVYYTPSPLTDPFTDVTTSPGFPAEFHHYLVSGAIYYLSQIEAASASNRGDTARVQYLQSVSTKSFDEFELRKKRLLANTNSRAEAGKVRVTPWFENVTLYR